MWGDKLKIVEESAVAGLNALKATPKKKKTGSEIYSKAIELDESLSSNVSEKVFKSYLSTISRDPDSKITKDAGSHGYYIKKEPTPLLEVETEETSQTTDDPTQPKRVDKEKLLYPILETWIEAKGYRTKDTSQMKGMGRWGNPDITGINVEETLGAYDIEVVTVEAKTSPLNFRYEFFEAVSHKRFANRVYFSFAASSNFLRESNEELRYYSELFRVGVIVIVIEDQHFEKFLNGELTEIDTDMVDVYELFSAPYEPRLKRWQKEFLNALKITDTKTLWSWGG